MEYLGKNFIHSIEVNMHHFTKTEIILAKFIIENPIEFASMSINEVASRLGISQATITRFCQKSSYTGFNEFRYELKRYNELKGDHGRTETYSTSEHLLSIHHDYLDVIDKTVKVNHSDAIHQVAEMMKRPGRIRVYGVGRKAVAASEFKRRFLPLDLRIDDCTEDHLVRVDASLADRKTLIFVLSVSGEMKEMEKSVALAKKGGAKIVCVTENINSPLAKLSDKVLLAASKPNNHLGQNVSSLVPFLMIMDLLYTEIIMSDYATKMKVLDKVNAALKK